MHACVYIVHTCFCKGEWSSCISVIPFDFTTTIMFVFFSITDETSCSEGDIRLVTGTTIGNYQGHVEICHLHIWKTVCSSNWDENDGRVVCQQLGLEFLSIPQYYKSNYGKGIGQIWLRNLSCTGSEAKLTECPHDEFSSNRCSSSVANVICTSK